MFSILRYGSKNKKTKNIGDYIQSIAARQFIGEKHTLIDREQLDKYAGPVTKVILNGWFMHSPKNWPPSKKIKPLFISFHINPDAIDGMLNNAGLEYLKHHEPIGCRDYGTLKLLQKNNIDAYFSSCLTTTLGETYRKINNNGDICFVDPFYNQYSYTKPLPFLKSIFTLISSYKKIRVISKKKYPNQTIKGPIKAAQFYKSYSKKFTDEVLLKARYITHAPKLSIFFSEAEKFEYADELLNYYSECKLVVTSRIHAALPCLGIGTPTIFIDDYSFNSNDNPERGRFDGLLSMMNVINYNNEGFSSDDLSCIVKGKIGIDININNPKHHKKYTHDLVVKCSSFASELNK